jgi:hypothetical protein
VATELTQSTVAPRLFSPGKLLDDGGLIISWMGTGRFFQVERKETLFAPFRPVSDLIPGTNFLDRSVLATNSQSFYRLRQW